MSGTYSRVVETTATGGVSNCIALPMPARGTLDRLIVKQTDSGSKYDFDYTVYNRKGACPTGNDLHVNAGTVTAVVANGLPQKCKLTITHDQFEPYGYSLQVGDTIYIKGTNVPTYNVVHTIEKVVDATTVETNVGYSSGITTNGLWQDSIPKVFPRHDPTMHLVASETTGTAGNASANFDMNRVYENDDNQNVIKRTQATSLWLDLQPGTSGTQTFEIAYTVNIEFIF
jgi:hypothetical protein